MAFARALALLLLVGFCSKALAQADAVSANGPDSKPYIPIRPKMDDAGEQMDGAPDLQVIDAPTAAVLDSGFFYSRTRFYSGGGALQYLSFGVFNGLNVGASLSMDNLVGRQNPVRVREPEAQIRYRFYDGNRFIPAMAIGYDGQGYDYDQTTQSYNEPRRGLYWVGSQELGIPGLEIHPSVNIADLNSNSLGGAVPLVYTYRNRVAALVEWDNINNLLAQSRLNAGVRFFVTPNFHLDFDVRGIGQTGRFPDGTNRGTERVIQMGYTDSF
ncbi:MAG: hypothetical protein ACYCPQ_07060 [Elusimicrobiota bacterium]